MKRCLSLETTHSTSTSPTIRFPHAEHIFYAILQHGDVFLGATTPWHFVYGEIVETFFATHMMGNLFRDQRYFQTAQNWTYDVLVLRGGVWIRIEVRAGTDCARPFHCIVGCFLTFISTNGIARTLLQVKFSWVRWHVEVDYATGAIKYVCLKITMQFGTNQMKCLRNAAAILHNTALPHPMVDRSDDHRIGAARPPSIEKVLIGLGITGVGVCFVEMDTGTLINHLHTPATNQYPVVRADGHLELGSGLLVRLER